MTNPMTEERLAECEMLAKAGHHNGTHCPYIPTVYELCREVRRCLREIKRLSTHAKHDAIAIANYQDQLAERCLDD